MIRLTKIFHFEMAHAINSYKGACKNLHGHSYELHVIVAAVNHQEKYIPAPGFVIDFKEIKHIVCEAVIRTFDHKLVLSREFISCNPAFTLQENLVIWEHEPTAENMLVYIKQELTSKFPPAVKLVQLKLFETKDSYAEWMSDNNFICY
jgi:6-pyruvoyltetrahydropterin/6-carboxytetrahydropterin synthase